MNNPWEKVEKPLKNTSYGLEPVEPKDHPLDLYWAKDLNGKYAFVFRYESTSEELFNLNLTGIEISSFQKENNNYYLILTLNDSKNWEIFWSLCQNLIQTTKGLKNDQDTPKLVKKRLKKWQQILKNKRIDILNEEKIKGLIGELYFLNTYLVKKYNSRNAINFWHGPKGAPQDFSINKTAVEIKCQSGSTLPSIKISRPEQLFPQFPNMFLFVITLGKSTIENKESLNLPNLIEEIEDKIQLGENPSETYEKFHDLLHEAKYNFHEKYADFNYLLIDEKVYEVEENFPRIDPDDLQEGIENTTYSIKISSCSNFEKNINSWSIINE